MAEKRWLVHESTMGEFYDLYETFEQASEKALADSDTFWGNVYVIVDLHNQTDGDDLRKNVPYIAYLGMLYKPEPKREDIINEWLNWGFF